jgi:hypothetical protein
MIDVIVVVHSQEHRGETGLAQKNEGVLVDRQQLSRSPPSRYYPGKET